MAKKPIPLEHPDPIEDTGVKLVDVATDAAIARSTGERLEADLKKHVDDQNHSFRRVYDKMDGHALQSTKQHEALKGEVLAIGENVHASISVAIVAAMEPVVSDVKAHRVWILNLLGGTVLLMLGIVGYLLINGSPWAAADELHQNGGIHAPLR